jgi:hypothetical protein
VNKIATVRIIRSVGRLGACFNDGVRHLKSPLVHAPIENRTRRVTVVLDPGRAFCNNSRKLTGHRARAFAHSQNSVLPVYATRTIGYSFSQLA